MDSETKKVLENHFEEDKSFQKSSTDQMNSFGVGLAEIKKILLVQNEVQEAHMKRVEPMLSAYEINTAFYDSLGQKLVKWGKRGAWLAGIIATYLFLKGQIISYLFGSK